MREYSSRFSSCEVKNSEGLRGTLLAANGATEQLADMLRIWRVRHSIPGPEVVHHDLGFSHYLHAIDGILFKGYHDYFLNILLPHSIS